MNGDREATRANLPRDLHKALELAQARGWRVTMPHRGSHAKWRPPAGSVTVVTSGTPNGGKRGLDNDKARLRRAGLPI